MDDSFAALRDLVWHEDEPIAWPSSVSLYFVSKLASEQVKVVLTGEGSAELFGGYERYYLNLLNWRYSRLYGVVPRGVRRSIRKTIDSSKLLNGSVRRKLGHTFLGRDHNVEALFLDNFYCAFAEAEQERLLRTAPDGVYADYMRYWNARPDAPMVPRMLYADQKTYLVELLMKQDQMSMACSIESRVPFLDHQRVGCFARIVRASRRDRRLTGPPPPRPRGCHGPDLAAAESANLGRCVSEWQARALAKARDDGGGGAHGWVNGNLLLDARGSATLF